MPIRLGFGHMVGNLKLTEIPRIFNKFFKISLKMSENKLKTNKKSTHSSMLIYISDIFGTPLSYPYNNSVATRTRCINNSPVLGKNLELLIRDLIKIR